MTWKAAKLSTTSPAASKSISAFEWPCVCNEGGVQDFSLSSGANTLATSWSQSIATPTTWGVATPAGYSINQASFSETLASIQANDAESSQASQSGVSTANATQPFQPGVPIRYTDTRSDTQSNDQLRSSRDGEGNQPSAEASVQSAPSQAAQIEPQSKPGGARILEHEDVYLSGPSREATEGGMVAKSTAGGIPNDNAGGESRNMDRTLTPSAGTPVTLASQATVSPAGLGKASPSKTGQLLDASINMTSPLEKTKQSKLKGQTWALRPAEPPVDTSSQAGSSTAPPVTLAPSPAPASTIMQGNSPASPLLSEAQAVPGVKSGASAAGKNSSTGLAFAVKIHGTFQPQNGATAPTGDAAVSPLATKEDSIGNQFSADLQSLMNSGENKGGGLQHANPEVIALGSSPGGSPMIATPAGAEQPAVMESANNSSADSAKEFASKESAGNVTAAVDVQPPATSSPKTVQVQVNGNDDQRVDLKLVEKGGALTISVRSSDSTLTKILQQQLPELSNKLNEQQVHAEWWTPEAQKVNAPPKSANESGHQDSSAGQQGRNQENQGQKGGRGTRQPDWVEDLADPRKSNQNGKQFTWHL